MKKLGFCFLLFHFSSIVVAQQYPTLIDPKATKQTKALYHNLAMLSQNYILFGHQHATEYGHGWRGQKNKSDVKLVTGSNPAVIGVDFSGLSGRPDSIIKRNENRLRTIIEDTYNRGGINTVSWHFSNPTSGGDFYWDDSLSKPAVKLMIPGGEYHQQYKNILQTVGNFAKSLKGNRNKTIPLIFRPYHELDGDWFWWGSKHCTPEELKTLWQFTVTYLRDSLQVHNFIYAFSPDKNFVNDSTYALRYPGNNWVDMVGVDNYGDFGRYGKYDLDSGIIRLKIVNDFAIKNNKLAAFTETGLESIPNETWWTQTLLAALKKHHLQMAYVLVWRNDEQSPTHYYAPYPGQASEKDFLNFYKSPYTLFENDLKNMYKQQHKFYKLLNK